MADRLPWKHTWEWGGTDFVHRDGRDYARIRKTHYTDPEKTWEWGVFVWFDHGDTGYVATKQEAADKATEAWWRLKAAAAQAPASVLPRSGTEPSNNGS